MRRPRGGIQPAGQGINAAAATNLRADIGEVDVVLADWWQEFSIADEAERQDLVDQAREEQARQRARSPRVHSKPVLRIAGPIVPLCVVGVGFAPDLATTIAALSALGIAIGVVDATMNMQAVSLQAAYGRPVISSCYAWFSLISIVGALLAAAAAGTAVFFWRRSTLMTIVVGMAVYLPLHIGLGW